MNKEIDNIHEQVGRAAMLVIEERCRQVEIEGYSVEHDDKHVNGELANAAACYIIPPCDCGDSDCPARTVVPDRWPWEEDAWKPSPDDRERELVKGLALGLAELERIRRTKKA